MNDYCKQCGRLEAFLPIPGFEAYSISTLGRVLRVLPGKGARCKMLSTQPNSGGYLRVCLCIDGVMYWKLVHHLVAETFIGPRPVGYDVDHRDRNRKFNCICNIRYRTIAKNRGYKGESNSFAKFSDSRRHRIKSLKHQNWSYTSIAKRYGMAISTVRYICLS